MQSKLVSAVEWWKKDRKWVCSLICYDGEFSQMWLEAGSELSFKVNPGRHCVGYATTSSRNSTQKVALEPWKAYEPCPVKAPITKGYKCSSCSREDMVNPCLICDGAECLAERGRQISCKDSTAYVYMASFGSTFVKVGVAHQSRIPHRWIEQGANLAKRIMMGNGMDVRRFEVAIHKSLNVLSGLRTSLKVDTMWKTQTKKEAFALANMEEQIRQRFPDLPAYHENLQDLSPIYALPSLDRQPLQLKIKKNQQITGTVMGAKGALLLLRVNGLPHLLNVKHLVGRKITLNKREGIASQRILDEFQKHR
jgi:hypothetical protein